MTKVAERLNGKKLYLLLVFASVLLAPIAISTNTSFAMGQPPSVCSNRYDGPITSAKITVGNKTFDPIADPGLSFELANDRSYTITFTIHTPTKSSQGNSDPGMTWYRTTSPGFGNGTCVNGAGPDKDVITTVVNFHPSNMAPTTSQYVEWNTLVSGFNYNVKWIYPKDPNLAAPTNLIARAISSGQIDLSWKAPSSSSVVTGYYIERSEDAGSTWYSINYNTGSTETSYSDSWYLAHSTSYSYRVSAMSSKGSGPPSNIASATTLNAVTAITLSATAGPPGKSLSISGTGFQSSAWVEVWFDTNNDGALAAGEPSVLVTADASGTFTTSMAIPTVPAGKYFIRVDGPPGGTVEASATFTVKSKINPTPNTGPGGTSVLISGSGFRSSVSGKIWFDTNGNGTVDAGEPRVAITADSSGAFKASLTMPTVPAGKYFIRADVPSGGTVEASKSITVT